MYGVGTHGPVLLAINLIDHAEHVGGPKADKTKEDEEDGAKQPPQKAEGLGQGKYTCPDDHGNQVTNACVHDMLLYGSQIDLGQTKAYL